MQFIDDIRGRPVALMVHQNEREGTSVHLSVWLMTSSPWGSAARLRAPAAARERNRAMCRSRLTLRDSGER